MKLSPSAVTTVIQFAEKEAILDRVLKTSTMMDALATEWVWDVISPADFYAALTAIRGPSDSLEWVAETVGFEERHALRAQERVLAELHKATVRALAVARVAWGEDTERLMVLASLGASAQQGPEIGEEAEAWETAWMEVDPGFVPVAGLTLASFQEKIAAARAAAVEARRWTVQRQRAQARLALALHQVNQWSQRWYAVATAMFDAETPQGDKVRRAIPTTYVPRYYAAAKRRRAERRAEGAVPETANPPAAEA
jgi:hypothetical protein